MRLVFTTWAWPSHWYAMAPLARSCGLAGHDVVVAVPPALVAEVGRAGCVVQPVGHDVDSVSMVREYALPADRRPEPAPPGRSAPRAFRMLLANAEAMLADLVALVRDRRADAVVFDPTAWAGPIAAQAAGIPAVRCFYGLDLQRPLMDVAGNLVAPLARRYGVTNPVLTGTASIDPVPPSLRLPGGEDRQPMRYVPFPGPGERPPSPEPAGAGRICVTWGHTMARLGAGRFFAGEVVRALAGLPAETVVALSAAQRELLGPVDPSVRVVVDAPLHSVLPGCDLVLAHGGAGTALTALSHGIPLLFVPQLPDHRAHARQVAAAGAGTLVPRPEATADRLRSEAWRLLHDGEARRRAGEIAGEIAAQPGPAELVPWLESLIAAAG